MKKTCKMRRKTRIRLRFREIFFKRFKLRACFPVTSLEHHETFEKTNLNKINTNNNKRLKVFVYYIFVLYTCINYET